MAIYRTLYYTDVTVGVGGLGLGDHPVLGQYPWRWLVSLRLFGLLLGLRCRVDIRGTGDTGHADRIQAGQQQ